MPAPSKRPLSAASSSANKKAKVVSKPATKPTVKEESKRKVPVTASASNRDQLDLEEAQIDEEDWHGDEASEDDDEDVEIDGGSDDEQDGDETMDGEGADGAEGAAPEKQTKDPEGEHTDGHCHVYLKAYELITARPGNPPLFHSCPTRPSSSEDGPTRPSKRKAKLGDPARVKVVVGPAQQEGGLDIQEGQGGGACSAHEPARGQDGSRREQARRWSSRPECESDSLPTAQGLRDLC
jgi:hypothetical protein